MASVAPAGPMNAPLPSATDWADRLGLKRVGREWCGPCPVCGGHDRLHVGQRRDGIALVGCRSCIDGRTPGERREAFAQVLRTGFPERCGSAKDRRAPVRGRTTFADRERKPAQRGGELSASVALLWARRQSPDGTPANSYLVERCVWPPAELEVALPEDCAWVPAETWPASRVARIPQLPPSAAGVLVFAYRDPQGLLRAVSCEALDATGQPCEPRWRRSLGTKIGSLFVTGPELRCFVEGELDALAAKWLKTGLAGAACGGTAGLRTLQLPRQGAGAWLLPDSDDAGYHAAVLAHARNPHLTVAWRENTGGDPASDLAEAIGERVASLVVEGISELQALRTAWQERRISS